MLTSDTLVNLMSGLGTGRDKSTGAAFALALLGKTQLDAAYRGDWIARKIVDVPAFDETREWRDWQAEKLQIELLEQEEARLAVQPKVAKARKLARLYGGSALYFGTAGEPSEPLIVDQVGKGGLVYLHVFTRHEMIAGELEQDPLSPLFGEPKKYSLAGTSAMVDIHPSRVVRFIGAELPDRALNNDGWGDSVLQAVNDAVMHAGTAAGTIAALLQEAKVDVIKVPDFMANLAAADYRARIFERYSLANLGKSITNSLLIDAEEEWDHKQISFAQLPEILNTYLQIASGAADIPATRLLGQTPGGLQSTGQSDIRNYYDRISAGQNLDLRPALSRLDEVLIRSALGSRPPAVHYKWAPLWQMTETESADVAFKKAQATKIYADAALMPDAALGKVVQNQLIEDGTYPGLDAALAEFGTGPDDREADAEALRQQTAAAGGTRTSDDPFLADVFDPNQPRDPQGRWTSAAVTLAQTASVAGQQGRPVRAVIGPAEKVSELSALVGFDVTGFVHAISNERISHILQAHGTLSSEAPRGQRPIEASDFGVIRQIVTRPDSMGLGRPNKAHGQPRVIFEKSVAGARYRYVAEVQRGKRRLDAVSMWKW